MLLKHYIMPRKNNTHKNNTPRTTGHQFDDIEDDFIPFASKEPPKMKKKHLKKYVDDCDYGDDDDHYGEEVDAAKRAVRHSEMVDFREEQIQAGIDVSRAYLMRHLPVLLVELEIIYRVTAG